MATSEHCTIADVRYFLTCCKCRPFLSEYKEKYVLLCVYMCTCTYAYKCHTHMQTQIQTHLEIQMRKSFLLCLHLHGLHSEPGFPRAARSSWLWCCSCLRSRVVTEAEQWQHCYQWSRNLPPGPACESWAELTSRNSWFLHTLQCCFCLVWLFHVLTTLGPDRGCSCITSPNWLLWRWLHCKYYKSEQL